MGHLVVDPGDVGLAFRFGAAGSLKKVLHFVGPAGSLGRRLLVKVSEIHHTGDAVPIVKPETSMADSLVEMTSKRLGCVLVLDDDGRPSHVFTDGDLGRFILAALGGTVPDDRVNDRGATALQKDPSGSRVAFIGEEATVAKPQRGSLGLGPFDPDGPPVLVGAVAAEEAVGQHEQIAGGTAKAHRPS